MNREDDVVEAHTPWRVDPGTCLQVRLGDGTLANIANANPTCHDACYRTGTSIETERETQTCPAGYVGTRVRVRTRTTETREYGYPVPHREDETTGGGDWGAWQWESSNCSQSNSGGSDDDDDDNSHLLTPGNRPDDDDDNGNNNNGGGGHPGLDSTPEQDEFYDHANPDRFEDNENHDPPPSNNNDDDDGGNNNNGGGCFLTTAVVERRGEADDGPTLTLLRSFRDGWLTKHPEGGQLIKDYYRLAPELVATIPETHAEWDRIATEVDAAVQAICKERLEEAYRIYRSMVERLVRTWLIQ